MRKGHAGSMAEIDMEEGEQEELENGKGRHPPMPHWVVKIRNQITERPLIALLAVGAFLVLCAYLTFSEGLPTKVAINKPLKAVEEIPEPKQNAAKPIEKRPSTPSHLPSHDKSKATSSKSEKSKSHHSKSNQSSTPTPTPVPVPQETGHNLENALLKSMQKPEFVYGGTWGDKESRAKLTKDHKPSLACHATTLVHLPDGEFLAAWFGGMYESAEDVAIYVSKRPKNGEWTEPIKAAKVHRNVPYQGKNKSREPPRTGGEPHWNPVLFCEGSKENPDICDGEISLFFKVGWKIPKWQTFVTRSNDGGKTWKEAKELVPGDEGGRGPVKNKAILLSNGNWLAPASLEGPSGWEGRRKPWRGFTDTSTDHGRTWTASNFVYPPSKSEGVIQPTLWESQPGHVHMLLRSLRGRNAKVWRADSTDYGKTWGQAYKTNLPNNNSGLDVAKLPHSGTLVLIYNPTTENRYPLRMSISKDDGKSWTVHLDIEKESGTVKEGHEFSYPAIIPWPASAPEEGVSVTYTWNRKRVAFFSISLKDLEERSRSKGRSL